MTLLSGLLAGAAKGAQDQWALEREKLKEEATRAFQMALQDRADARNDLNYERQRTDQIADRDEQRDYEQTTLQKQRDYDKANQETWEQGSDSYGAYQENTRTGKRDYHTTGKSSREKLNGWETKTISDGDTEYTFSFNKDTGEKRFDDPRMFVPTISPEDAKASIEKGGFMGIGGKTEREIQAEANAISERSKPIYSFSPDYQQQSKVGLVIPKPEGSNEKPYANKPTSETAPKTNKYIEELNNTKLGGILTTYGDEKAGRSMATLKKQLSNMIEIRQNLKGQDFVDWANEGIRIAQQSGDERAVEMLKSQLRNAPQ